MLDRINNRTFARNHEQAAAGAREQLRIIMANLHHLRKLRGGEKMIRAAQSFQGIILRHETLTPNQLSFVDSIYEKTMKAAGFESVGVHVDKKRGIRY